MFPFHIHRFKETDGCDNTLVIFQRCPARSNAIERDEKSFFQALGENDEDLEEFPKKS